MRNEVLEYFEDLESPNIIKQLNNKKGKIPAGVHITNTAQTNVKKCTSYNDPLQYYIKYSETAQAISAVASSKMYSSTGIATPKVYLLKSQNGSAKTIQQDVSTIKGFDITLAKNDFQYSKIKSQLFGKYKWQLFYDIDLMNTLLQFMTRDCLTQLQNLFLENEIRTDNDTHSKNYFFYKKNGSKLYEGVIAIDLEQMLIYNFCGSSEDDFLSFLSRPYYSATPQQTEDYVCYMNRVRDIRELIQDGVLSQENIESLISALKYDFPKDIKNATKQLNLHGKSKKDIIVPAERLWEYNRKTIGKDLGL